jgi:uncharacterized protein (DUF427 family)
MERDGQLLRRHRGRTSPDAVWSYLEPKPKAQNIAGYVAFWKGVRVKT